MATRDIDFDFAPNVSRARRLDARMRAHLTDSLSYLADCLASARPALSHTLAAIALKGRRGAHYSPASFGLYYDAASALLKDDIAAAASFIDKLRDEPELTRGELEVLSLDDLPAATRERYCRLMDADPQTPFILLPPPVHEAAALKRRCVAALQNLKALLPELAGEVDALGRQMILVAGDPALGYDFAGGSCYMLWGALFINAASHPDLLSMMEAIAHESAHSLLFGFTIDVPLVLNDAGQRYSSPLRDDPRPMDGIFHATFVCARMHWAMAQLASLPAVDVSLAAQAKARAEIHRRSFYSGLALVRQHATLSPTGRALIDGAERYMAGFPA